MVVTTTTIIITIIATSVKMISCNKIQHHFLFLYGHDLIICFLHNLSQNYFQISLLLKWMILGQPHFLRPCIFLNVHKKGERGGGTAKPKWDTFKTLKLKIQVRKEPGLRLPIKKLVLLGLETNAIYRAIFYNYRVCVNEQYWRQLIILETCRILSSNF